MYCIVLLWLLQGFIKTSFQGTAWESQAKTVDNAKHNNRYNVEPQVLTHYENSIEKATKLMSNLPWASPNVVSEQIYNAVADSRPLTRYLAGYDVQGIPFITLLPDRIYDMIMGRTFA